MVQTTAEDNVQTKLRNTSLACKQQTQGPQDLEIVYKTPVDADRKKDLKLPARYVFQFWHHTLLEDLMHYPSTRCNKHFLPSKMPIVKNTLFRLNDY